jgi:hypothetical protein
MIKHNKRNTKFGVLRMDNLVTSSFLTPLNPNFQSYHFTRQFFFVESHFICKLYMYIECLCGLVVRVLGYRSEGPGSIPGTTGKKKVVRLERGPLSLVSTTEELLDRKVAAPV